MIVWWGHCGQTDLLGRYAEQGTDVNFRFLFKGKPEHYYALVDVNNQPRPEYLTYWLYAQLMGDTYVTVEQGATDDISQVAAHAAVRSKDGGLGVVLVNKTTSSQAVSVTLRDFTPYTATQYTLQGESYDGTSVTLNGQAVTSAQLAAGLAQSKRERRVALLPEYCDRACLWSGLYTIRQMIRLDERL